MEALSSMVGGLSVKSNSGRRGILVGKKNVSPVRRIVSYDSDSKTYSVLFEDGSVEVVHHRNINPVLTDQFHLIPAIAAFNTAHPSTGDHAFMYLRTSSDCASVSIDVQRTDIEARIAKAGQQLSGIGIDEGISARNMTNLRGLAYILEEMTDAAKTADRPIHFYMWNASRFSRNVVQAIEKLDSLAAQNIQIYFVADDLAYTTANNRNNVRMALSSAQQLSDSTSEIVKRAFQKKKSQGLHVGGVPYGKRVNEDGKLVPNMREMKIIAKVKAIYAKAAKNGSTRRVVSVVEECKKQKISLRGNPISVSTVNTLFRRGFFV